MHRNTLSRRLVAFLLASLLPWAAAAQESDSSETSMPSASGPRVTSPEVHADRSVTFRILAPAAASVRLGGTDIPPAPSSDGTPDPMAVFMGRPMEANPAGVWEVTVGPLAPGSYRYHFVVDGVNTVDPRSPAVSESNENTWSLVHVPGAAFMDTRDVPRGAVSEITYFSQALQRFRRMHVYTPPGYEAGKGRYPVLYLLHGAMDSDDSWSTVGRAGFILDNLVAEGKAEPMVVVMPDGHTGPFQFGQPLDMSEFIADFTGGIVPWVERHYRVHTDRTHRALAGLSMGGAHTLEIAMANLERYGYLGVFSSGAFTLEDQPLGGRSGGPAWETKHAAALADEAAREDLRLFWFATGREDFLLGISRATVAALREAGFDVEYEETDGGHTWANWREYLREFAPRLFR